VKGKGKQTGWRKEERMAENAEKIVGEEKEMWGK
jgi:hypothetical protein